MLKQIRFAILFTLLACLIPGCSSGPSIGPVEGFSGGVPITARTLTSVKPDPKAIQVSVTWPVSVSGSAFFRYFVLDYSDPDQPLWVPQGDALDPIPDDTDSDWDVEVPAAGTTTSHSINIRMGIAKTYRIVVLVSTTNAGVEYVGSAWFEATP